MLRKARVELIKVRRSELELERDPMSFNLRNRSLLRVQDYAPGEFRHLLDLARDLKRAKYSRTERQRLAGKQICLILEDTSARTRGSFEVACFDQGAHVTYLDSAGSPIGHQESFKDAARVLGRMYDAIEYRGRPRRASARWRSGPASRSSTASPPSTTRPRCSPTS